MTLAVIGWCCFSHSVGLTIWIRVESYFPIAYWRHFLKPYGLFEDDQISAELVQMRLLAPEHGACRCL